VVFICELTTKFPTDDIPSIVDCIYDFAHRHKSPMIYSIEGIPKKETLTLPTGEEITLNLKPGGGGSGGGGRGGSESGGEEGEESSGGGHGDYQEEPPIVIDDTLLAKMTRREEEKKVKEKPEEKKVDEKKSPAKTGKSPKGRAAATSPKKGKKGKEGDDEEESEDLEHIANELFGDKVHYVTTNNEVARKLRAAGYIPVVDGIIPGVSGGIIAQAPLTEQEVTVLLTPSSIIFPDAEAAVKTIKVFMLLNPSLNLENSIKTLEKEGEDLKKLMKGLLSGLDTTSLRKSGSVPYGMYQ